MPRRSARPIRRSAPPTRHGIHNESARKSQLIEITCDHGSLYAIRKQGGGYSGKLYDREAALALIRATEKLAGGWTTERAEQELSVAFDWVDANADTNPGRLLYASMRMPAGLNSRSFPLWDNLGIATPRTNRHGRVLMGQIWDNKLKNIDETQLFKLAQHTFVNTTKNPQSLNLCGF